MKLQFVEGEQKVPETPEVSLILDAINAGNPGAEARLMELVYSELREMASSRLAREKAGHSLSESRKTLLSRALAHWAWTS